MRHTCCRRFRCGRSSRIGIRTQRVAERYTSRPRAATISLI
jgi:hypothetical protein